MIRIYEQKKSPVIAVEEVPSSEVYRYGIIDGKLRDGVYEMLGEINAAEFFAVKPTEENTYIVRSGDSPPRARPSPPMAPPTRYRRGAAVS